MNLSKMEEIPFEKVWWFSDIEGVRELDYAATYYPFSYEELPPIPQNLDDEFNWMRKHPLHHNFTFNFQDQLKRLQKEAIEKGLTLPKAFLYFMSNPSLINRMRSNTDCYFELGDFIEEIPNTEGLHFLHFLSDSQYCLLWFLCLDKHGNHCIVASGNEYCSQAESREIYPYETSYYCAPTFNEFIYRFWLENEIWYKISWENAELNDVEKKYVNYYLEMK
ncbi:MAG: hypothetical protein R3E32_00780 [Chitinophagales bacterium]